MLRILYMVHDLSDPAVSRRVTMLEAGGAAVTLAGFRRDPVPGGSAGQSPVEPNPIELGRTKDGRFGQRLAAVMAAALSLGRALRSAPRPDIVIGRNLEMLALANRARTIFGGDIPVVYECLDIHRLLLDRGMVGKAMRGAERFFSRDAALLVTSSPAFVREYFHRFRQVEAPVALLQNKVLELATQGAAPVPAVPRPDEGGPWRIGWFGALRCRKSLELLAALTQELDGRIEVVLRGRPAHREFDDFDGFVAAQPHIRFAGPYRNPDDLAAIYGEVHFCWAIDFFEEGLNSAWLLPNRLYEGCRYGAVPIAMKGTETGCFLQDRRLGLLLEEPTVKALKAVLGGIDAKAYADMRRHVAAQDGSNWVCGTDDCRALVERLRSIAGAPREDRALMEAAA